MSNKTLLKRDQEIKNKRFVTLWMIHNKLDFKYKESWMKALEHYRDLGYTSTARTCREYIDNNF